jgi:hypothetical protein
MTTVVIHYSLCLNELSKGKRILSGEREASLDLQTQLREHHEKILENEEIIEMENKEKDDKNDEEAYVSFFSIWMCVSQHSHFRLVPSFTINHNNKRHAHYHYY